MTRPWSMAWWLVLPVTLVSLACGRILETTELEAPDAGVDPPLRLDAGVLPEPDASLEPEDAGCTRALGAKVISHVCSHTQAGPYDTVVATATAETAPPVDRIHVPYEVVLAEASEGGGYAGMVRYTPSRPDEHVLLVDEGATLVVRDALEEVPVDFAGPTPGCETSGYAVAAVLTQGHSYTLELHSDRRVVIWFAEHLEAFAEPWQVCP